MARVWEIVEKRGDGKWYTNMRTKTPDEGTMFRSWVLAHDPMRYAFRECDEAQSPLASSLSHMVQVDDYGRKRSSRVMDDIKARRVGLELATAMIALFELRPGGRDGGAQYALARSLASMTGEFENADVRDGFISGVMDAFRNIPAQVAAPANTVIDGNA